MYFVPIEIQALVEECFGVEHSRAYGQLATANTETVADVRTVHFHYLGVEKGIGFFGHDQSPKMRQIRSNPKVACCFWDTERAIQFRWYGSADFVSAKDLAHSYYEDFERMWMHSRLEIRKSYWLDSVDMDIKDELPKSILPDQIAPNALAVIIAPNRWDIFQHGMDDYRNGKRVIYRLKGNEWQSSKVAIIHSKSIHFD